MKDQEVCGAILPFLSAEAAIRERDGCSDRLEYFICRGLVYPSRGTWIDWVRGELALSICFPNAVTDLLFHSMTYGTVLCGITTRQDLRDDDNEQSTAVYTWGARHYRRADDLMCMNVVDLRWEMRLPSHPSLG